MQSLPPTAMSVRYSYAGEMLPSSVGRKNCRQLVPLRQFESIRERERRIFGGNDLEEDREDDEGLLKAGMLDVVLRLFHGVDYDDDDACC